MLITISHNKITEVPPEVPRRYAALVASDKLEVLRVKAWFSDLLACQEKVDSLWNTGIQAYLLDAQTGEVF